MIAVTHIQVHTKGDRGRWILGVGDGDSQVRMDCWASQEQDGSSEQKDSRAASRPCEPPGLRGTNGHIGACEMQEALEKMQMWLFLQHLGHMETPTQEAGPWGETQQFPLMSVPHA